MRWLAEAVHRVPSVQDINVEGTMGNFLDTPINDQWDDSIDATQESNQPIGDNITSSIEQPLNERENTVREPKFVAECVSLLNGGPPTSQQDAVTPITTAGTMTSTTAPTVPISMEAVSISSTPPISSTGMEERISLNDPIRLTEEDPQIRCTVCNTIDCMMQVKDYWGHIFVPIGLNIQIHLEHKTLLEQMKYNQWNQRIILLRYCYPGTMNQMQKS